MVAVGRALTTIVTPFEFTDEATKQEVELDVISHVIISPFTSDVEEYVEVVSPAIVELFFFHTYEGESPPFVGVAVNVTEVPEQIVVALAVIDTFALRSGLTVAVTAVRVELTHPVVLFLASA
jgi:outer membrane protein W